MHEKIRAKFVCTSFAKRMNYDNSKPFLWDYEFSPVTSGSEENKKFYAYTPSGSIKLSSIIFGQFEVGKEYYLDFIPFVETE